MQGVTIMVNEKAIKDYIFERYNVTISSLCEHFSISESTARRVLKKLEEKKLITRYHGGAYPNIGSIDSTAVTARMKSNWDKKVLIAQKAAKQVMDGSTLVMLGGTTVYAMCRFLEGKNITVITNSLIVFSALQKARNITIILLGGLFNPSEYELGGVLTNHGMRNIRADYMFMGSMGFDEKLGFTTKDIESLELYQTCIESSNKVFVLADSSKHKAGGTAVTAKLGEIDTLITDEDISHHYLNAVQGKLNVIIAKKHGE
jgi:DeoR family fructose operon transcriptional repressor